MYIGTSHFHSRDAAISYYHPYFGADTAKEVDRKIADGEIHIGKPKIKTGEKLILADNNTRYVIDDGKP